MSEYDPPHERLRGKIRHTRLDDTYSRARKDNGQQREAHDDQPLILPGPKQPYEVAQVFLGRFATDDDGLLMLRYWRGDWWSWRGSHWRRLDARAVRRLLYRFLGRAAFITDKGGLAQWDPTSRKVFDLLDAMASLALLDRDIEQPVWLDLDDQDAVDQNESGSYVACSNGLYDVISGRLVPHTPRYFNLVAVPFVIDAKAPAPQRWLAFLQSLWPEPDAPEIDVLGEWFGYVISGRRDLHKMLLMIGPTRGGKGVIARMLAALVGRQNTAGPTLNSLASEFGLAPLLGKPLAVISDARLSNRTAISVVVERLLSISGGDMLTINVKYHEQVTCFLPTRLHIVSNEMPAFSDASSAVIGRFLFVITQHSWFGREDLTLEPDLMRELPGIFSWALAGLGRLAANGWRFTPNPNADAAILEAHDLASPIRAFARERCELGPDKRVPRELLYETYKLWAQNGGRVVWSREVFGTKLRAAFPMVADERPRTAIGGRYTAYRGIAIRSQDADHEL